MELWSKREPIRWQHPSIHSIHRALVGEEMAGLSEHKLLLVGNIQAETKDCSEPMIWNLKMSPFFELSNMISLVSTVHSTATGMKAPPPCPLIV